MNQFNPVKHRRAYNLLYGLLENLTRRVLLEVYEKGEVAPRQMMTNLRIDRSQVSRELNKLRRYRLLDARKEGRNIFYKINTRQWDKINCLLLPLTKHDPEENKVPV